VALDALVRIDGTGAYANVLLPELLARSGLDTRDRAFATDLVYGTTRRRRALDFVVDRYLVRDVEPAVRAALRLGAYQIRELGTPPHAAVDATVEVAPGKARPLVNAVLRRVAAARDELIAWPDRGTALSYPDWIVERLVADLGEDDAIAALEQMNEKAAVTNRADGYTQDLASQWVATFVGGAPGERVLDVCAAPGGKATALAATGAYVVAADLRSGRARRMAGNVARLGLATVGVVVADGLHPPYRAATFDRVLVDAPCSGLGALQRRPDARWRVDAAGLSRLVALQRELLDAASALVRPGGVLTFATCTLTAEEGPGIDAWIEHQHPHLRPVAPPGPPWVPCRRGARLLPQAAGTDGMMLFAYEVGGRGRDSTRTIS
jgi:16S rRNA (cytosine967-C5)-methyltransferase